VFTNNGPLQIMGPVIQNHESQKKKNVILGDRPIICSGPIICKDWDFKEDESNTGFKIREKGVKSNIVYKRLQ
jgi:hypothetical protein